MLSLSTELLIITAKNIKLLDYKYLNNYVLFYPLFQTITFLNKFAYSYVALKVDQIFRGDLATILLTRFCEKQKSDNHFEILSFCFSIVQKVIMYRVID